MHARRSALGFASLLLASSIACAQATTPPATPAAPAAPTAPAAPAANLPKAEDLLAKELAARGGKEAHDAIKHMTSTSTMEFVGVGVKATSVSQLSENGKFLMTVTIAKGTDVVTGYDGTVGWSIDPTMGPRLLEGKELEQLQMDASFARQSSIASQFEKASVVGEAEWNKRPAYEVALTSKDRTATIYIDKESSLITGMKMTAETVRGSTPVTTTVLEFQEFEGPKGKVKMPTKTEMKVMGIVNLVTVEKVTFDPIDAKVFELPAAIKALVDERNAPKDGAAPAKDAPATAPATPAAPKQ